MIALLNGNALHIPLSDNTVQCVITSPPYYGLRDYGTAQWEGGDPSCDHLSDRGKYETNFENSKQATSNGTRNRDIIRRDTCPRCGAVRIDQQIGLESTPAEYVAHIVAVMRECWRVLRDDGVMWLNLGDSYAGGGGYYPDAPSNQAGSMQAKGNGNGKRNIKGQSRDVPGLKPKDLCGIPWRCAFALQEAGWYLRSDIIWSKPNPMPESVTDRPTKAHEYVFLLTKRAQYYYDAEVIKETSTGHDGIHSFGKNGNDDRNDGDRSLYREEMPTRNKRSVWEIATSPYSGAHYATFPPDLVRPMVLAGTSPRACETCGAPWERVTERDTDYPDDYGSMGDHGSKWMNEDKQSSGHRIQKNMNALRAAGRDHDNPFPNKTTTGWRPTCLHDNSGSARCIVLDPFCGSGTVGQVCRESGRDFVGIDLSLKYLTDNAMPRALNTNTPSSMETLPIFAMMGDA